jgi:hypothetical protein
MWIGNNYFFNEFILLKRKGREGSKRGEGCSVKNVNG